MQILETLMNDLHATIVTVNPISEAISAIGITDLSAPPDISVITVTLLQLSIQIAWGSVTNAQLYEIREGAVWATATFVLKTSSLSAALNPRLVGTYNMLIKAISPAAVYSNNAFAFNIVVPSMGSLVLSSSVIDNNVLLSWTIPTSSFQIDHYNVYRNTVKFAEIKSNFLARFEAAAGTYLFEVEAVDVAGNLTAKASASAQVKTPPDYVLQNSRLMDLAASTKVNAILDAGKILACIDLVETIDAHFTSRGWASAQDQVTAGYERWIQDNLLTGSILDEFDYGTVLTNTVAVVSFVKEVFSGTSDVTVAVKLSWSTDGVSWSSESIGEAQFIPSLRYLRTKLEFSAPNDDAMIYVSNVEINLSVKREVDSGSVNASVSDIDGTLVFFNKTFKDIDSLTATAESLTPITPITIFDDAPNPVSFRIMAFDSSGQRVTHVVDWKARGIV